VLWLYEVEGTVFKTWVRLPPGPPLGIFMILSPCIKVCKLQDNVCIGCGRTVEEIARWLKYSDAEREQIMQRLSKDS